MTDLLRCPFCGAEPELNILYEDIIDEKVIDGVVIRCSKCGISKEKLTVEAATAWWNTRAQPQSLTGCLHPGKEPKSCQYEGQCLSASCNHHGKTWYVPRMTLEAQDPNVLYPPKETT